MNQPGDLQILHEIVCRDYGKFREAGGRADSPYVPFFMNFKTAWDAAKETGVRVSPTMVILRQDGTHGTINLVELFTEMGYL